MWTTAKCRAAGCDAPSACQMRNLAEDTLRHRLYERDGAKEIREAKDNIKMKDGTFLERALDFEPLAL